MKSKLLLTSGFLLTFLVFAGAVATQTGSKENSLKDKIAKSGAEVPNISELVDFSGQATDEIFPSNGVWQPFGPYRTINIQDKQRIVGYGSAVFGTSKGSVRISISLCYVRSGSSILTAFSGNNHLTADADTSRRTFAVAASGTLPAGTYSVGYCVMNRGTELINNNDYVNGWMIVIN
ncbi:MAG TPA: hypothetical protein VGC97_14675 [Pyrinomonadaceae bacterium]|jgi:hypothetical protein